MSSLTSKFTEAEIVVFWNLEQCPIPNDLSPASIYANIKLALKNMGYTGRISMLAYTDGKQNKKEFDLVNIYLFQNPEPRLVKVGFFMSRDVYSWWGIEHRDEPTNLLVISNEDCSRFSGFAYLKKNENNLLLAHPRITSGALPPTASSVWLWTSLSTGGSPFHNHSRLRHASVFWDLDGCPIPNDLSVASISANIRLALRNKGYNGSFFSIVAYSVAKQIKEEFDLVNIKLIHPGTSQKKVNVMLMDVYLWGIEHRDEPTNLMVISEDISQDNLFVSGLVNLSKKDNNLLLAHPRNTSGVLLHTASSIWLWTSLSTGGSPLDNQTGSLQAANPGSACLKRSLRVAKKQKKRWTKASHFKLKMSLILGLRK